MFAQTFQKQITSEDSKPNELIKEFGVRESYVLPYTDTLLQTGILFLLT